MKRRTINFALGLAAAAWPPLARGQQSSKPLRVGLVGVETFSSENAFIQRLGELGFVQGRNLSIDREVYFPEFLDASFDSIVKRGTDILLALGPECILKSASALRSGP